MKNKVVYEKFDDTVQYIGNDKVPEWQPTSEQITVEEFDKELTLTTNYESGVIASKTMQIVERNQGRLIAQHLDEHLGISVFVQNSEESDEATLTLMNDNYIVGRYLRRVKTHTSDQ